MCLVAQSCPTLCDPVDCSPPGSSGHGDSPGKNTGVGCHALLQGHVTCKVKFILLSKSIQMYSDESQNIVNIWVMGYWGAGNIPLLDLNNKNFTELYTPGICTLFGRYVTL